MNYFNIEQGLGTITAMRIAEQDFQRFHLQFSYFARTPYMIWIGLSTEQFPRVVIKIHAPFCHSLNKAIKNKPLIWRTWSSITRIWEIEYDTANWAEIIESVKNDTLQSLLEHIFYYQEEELIQMEVDRAYAEIQKNFMINRQLYPKCVVYGASLNEFKNGLIHVRPNYHPQKQYVRVEIYAHKRFLGKFKDFLKRIGYEPLHFHFDPQFKAWSFTLPDSSTTQRIIDHNTDPDTAWINLALNRIIEWFTKFKIQKIKLFDTYVDTPVENELIECCRIETESGEHIFL
jgi:hypothetical protein